MRTFEDALREIRSFLDKNKREIVMIYLDHQPNIKEWNKTHEVIQSIQSTMGDILFTPEFRKREFNDKWPNFGTLLRHNKRVIIASRSDMGNEVHKLVFRAYWNEKNSILKFKPYPSCEPYSPFEISRFVEDLLGEILFWLFTIFGKCMDLFIMEVQVV